MAPNGQKHVTLIIWDHFGPSYTALGHRQALILREKITERSVTKMLGGHNFDFRAKSSWEDFFNIYKKILSRGFCSKVKIVTAQLFGTPPYLQPHKCEENWYLYIEFWKIASTRYYVRWSRRCWANRIYITKSNKTISQNWLPLEILNII